MMSALVGFLATAFYFVLVLGILVFIHEFGHFLAAKAFGVRVEVFSLGFGRRVVGFKRGETDYRLAAIPLGGYVKMSGEFGAEDDKAPDPKFFTSKPRWQRLIVMLAGPAMNVVLALVLWTGLFMHGTEVPDLPDGPPVVERTEAGSPAEKAGLQPGDVIVELAGKKIDSIDDYETELIFHPGKEVVYGLRRGGKGVEARVAVAAHPRFGTGWDGVRPRIPIIVGDVVPGAPAEKAGLAKGDRILEVDGRAPAGIESVSKLINAGGATVAMTVERGGKTLTFDVAPQQKGASRMIGISVGAARRLVRYSFGQAALQSGEYAWKQAGFLFRTIGALLKRDVGLSVMSGPIEIARASREQAQAGFVAFVAWIAFISLQLGIFNLVPLPVLDGGHVAILAIEGAVRRDLPLVVKERILQIGLVLLLALAAVVIFQDIGKIFGRREPPPAAAAEAPAKPAAPSAPAAPAKPTPTPTPSPQPAK